MDRKRTPIVVLVILVLVVAGVMFWRQRTMPPETQATSASGVGDTANADREALPAGARRISPATIPDDPSAAEVLQAREEEQKRIRVINEAGKAKLLGQYQSESVDQRWASAKQQALEALQSNGQIEQLGARPVSFDVACRSSTCRIQADFASRLAADDWVTLYLLNAGPEMTKSHYQRTDYPDGTASVELYGQAR